MRLLRILGALALVVALGACLGDEPDILNCEDIGGVEEADFSALAVDLQMWCGSCHTADSPVYGYDFSSASSSYESTAHRADRIYAQLATGLMPPGPVGWSDQQLRAFRTWYCHGALYE